MGALGRLETLLRGVLVFWAAWLGVVALTNILDALKHLQVIPASFRFTSGNFPWMESVMRPLGVPEWLMAFQFGGVILWEVLACVLFIRAFRAYRGRPLAQEPEAVVAFAVNAALWAMFQILDEVFLAFEPEAVHRVIFGNQLLTALLFLAAGAWGMGRGTLANPSDSV
jgi:hypothetical protein